MGADPIKVRGFFEKQWRRFLLDVCFVADSLYHREHSSWRLKVPERMANIPSENRDITKTTEKREEPDISSLSCRLKLMQCA